MCIRDSAYTALIENGDSMYYFKRQILFCGAGFVIIYVVSRINYHWYIGKAKAIYFFSPVSYTHLEVYKRQPEGIAVAVTALLHVWKRNNLLSIGVGTVLYMVLVQAVF